MGIHHSEFDKMFSCLEKEIPISLTEAIGKWEHIKDTEKVTIKRWKELLEERSLGLMDNSYSVGTAMMRAWEDFYDPMAEDGERGYLCISELRDSFFNESLDKLEAYKEIGIHAKPVGGLYWIIKRKRGIVIILILRETMIADV